MKWLMRVLGVTWILFGLTYLLRYLYWQGWSWNWNLFGNFATWILAGGIFFVFWQIMEARRSTHAQVAVDLFRELRSDRTLEILRFIYNLKAEEDVQKLSSIDKHGIDHVLDRLEILGALVAHGIIDERIAIEAYGGPPVLKCWYKLRGYINGVRNGRGLFCKYVEDFARRTVKYQIKHAPKDEWIHFLKQIPPTQDKDKINLIEEFKGNLLSRRERGWSWFIRYFTHPFISCQELYSWLKSVWKLSPTKSDNTN